MEIQFRRRLNFSYVCHVLEKSKTKNFFRRFTQIENTLKGIICKEKCAPRKDLGENQS